MEEPFPRGQHKPDPAASSPGYRPDRWINLPHWESSSGRNGGTITLELSVIARLLF